MVQSRIKEFNRIKNEISRRRPRDFEFHLLGLFFLLLWPALGFGLQLVLSGSLETGLVARVYTGLLVAAGLYVAWPGWASLLVAPLFLAAIVAFGGSIPGFGTEVQFLPNPTDGIPLLFALVALLVAPSFLVVAQWDKVVVLRLGKSRKVLEPGVHALLPLADRCAAFVDTRIRVTDFSAEKILTQDTVPVHIDALAFWMIWDTQKAILEVEHFLEAVTLSAQTALRDSIGKYSLSTLLSERETLYREIQGILDAKTNPWGITILSVEFTDIVLPKKLESVMSAKAQAEREKSARILLSQAEAEIADQFVQAAKTYDGHPQAMNLRGMNMIFEAMKTRGSLVMVPGSALEGIKFDSSSVDLAKIGDPTKVGEISGLTALAKSTQGTQGTKGV